mgnify:CR=1 FL=1
MPRTGARRSSLEALSRGRWATRAPFGGWGRCGLLISAPPMCRAGWSRGSWGCGRGRLLSGGRFKPPRPFGPPPPQAGGLRRRRDGGAFPGNRGFLRIFSRKCIRFAHFPEKSAMQHTPKEQPLTPGKPHRRAHVVSHARPSVLVLQPVFRSAPRRGAHTAKPNSIACELPAGPQAARMPRRRLGGRTIAQSPRPFPSGKGGEGSRIRAAGNRCGGTGTPRIGPLFRSWSPIIPTGYRCVKGRKIFPMGNFCFDPLTHRHPAGALTTPNGKTNTERK